MWQPATGPSPIHMTIPQPQLNTAAGVNPLETQRGHPAKGRIRRNSSVIPVILSH